MAIFSSTKTSFSADIPDRLPVSRRNISKGRFPGCVITPAKIPSVFFPEKSCLNSIFS
jgi:hypothetical protein